MVALLVALAHPETAPEQRDHNATGRVGSPGSHPPLGPGLLVASKTIHSRAYSARECLRAMSLTDLASSVCVHSDADHRTASLHIARIELAARNVLPVDTSRRLAPVWHALLACWSPPTTSELARVAAAPPRPVAGAVADLRRLGLVDTQHSCHHAVDPACGHLAHPRARTAPPLPRPPGAYLAGRPVLDRPPPGEDRLSALLCERGLPAPPSTVRAPAREVLAELIAAAPLALASVELADRLNRHRGNIDRALQQLRAVGAVTTEDHKHFPSHLPQGGAIAVVNLPS